MADANWRIVMSEPATKSRDNQSTQIDISNDFSKFPGPRYETLGPNSGQLFRESKLLPALIKHEKVTVNLDGTKGYGSSFLEESFGGLVRSGKISKDDISKKLSLVSNEEPELIDEILEYIEEA